MDKFPSNVAGQLHDGLLSSDGKILASCPLLSKDLQIRKNVLPSLEGNDSEPHCPTISLKQLPFVADSYHSDAWELVDWLRRYINTYKKTLQYIILNVVQPLPLRFTLGMLNWKPCENSYDTNNWTLEKVYIKLSAICLFGWKPINISSEYERWKSSDVFLCASAVVRL